MPEADDDDLPLKEIRGSMTISPKKGKPVVSKRHSQQLSSKSKSDAKRHTFQNHLEIPSNNRPRSYNADTKRHSHNSLRAERQHVDRSKRNSSMSVKTVAEVVEKAEPTSIYNDLDGKNRFHTLNTIPTAMVKPSDACSHFVTPQTLGFMRGFFATFSISFVIWGIILESASTFFLSFFGLNFFALAVYFSLAFFRSYRYVTGAQQALFSSGLALPTFEILFVVTSSCALVMPIIFWVFTTHQPLFKNSYLQVAGHHLPFLMSMLELFLSQNFIVKMYALGAPVSLVLYFFLTWITHYVGGIEWPLTFFADFFRVDLNPLVLIAVLAVSILTMTCSVVVVYLLVQLRDRIAGRAKSSPLHSLL